MTEEIKEHNFQLFVRKLEGLGLPTEQLVEKYGEQLKNASFSTLSDTNLVGDGTLIETILKKLTPFAVRFNLLLPENKQVNQNTLVKICLLHQIAKAIRMIPNENQWEVEKRGMIYTFAPNQPSIRTGLHSLILAQEVGITFTAEEAEAMTVNDRDLSDDQARWHSSLLSSIVRMANETTYLISKN